MAARICLPASLVAFLGQFAYICRHILYLLTSGLVVVTEWFLRLFGFLDYASEPGYSELRKILWRSRLGIADSFFGFHFLSWPVGRVKTEEILDDNATVYSLWSGGVMLAQYDEPVSKCLHVETAPFFGIDAFELAKRLIFVKHEAFHQAVDGKLGGKLCTNVVILMNSGRCGSTLMSKMIGRLCSDVAVYSEPTYLPALTAFCYKMDPKVKNDLISAVVRYENRPVKGKCGYFVKPTHVYVTITLDLNRSVPDLKFAYMDRKDKIALCLSTYCLYKSMWAVTIIRILNKYHQYGLISRMLQMPDFIIEFGLEFDKKLDLGDMRDYAFFMTFYHLLMRNHITENIEGELPLCFYEDLVSNPKQTLQRMYDYSGFEQKPNFEKALTAFGQDAQAGTPISNENMSKLRIEQINEATRVKYDNYVAALREKGLQVEPLKWDCLDKRAKRVM